MQSRAEKERQIAALPEEERTFERFRFWWTALPESERLGRDDIAQVQQGAFLAKYAEWLKNGGFATPEVEKQLALLKKRGGAADAEFWNQYLIADRRQWLNSEANGFLIEMVKGRKPGKALDVAMGDGGNSIWLAQQGWEVTSFDPADQAVAVARAKAQKLGLAIRTEITTMEQFDFGENQWDLVVPSYAGCSQIAQQVEKALKPGSILVEEAFHTESIRRLRLMVEQRRRFVDEGIRQKNRLTACLKTYYPQFLEWSSDPSAVLALDFLRRWPTLQEA